MNKKFSRGISLFLILTLLLSALPAPVLAAAQSLPMVENTLVNPIYEGILDIREEPSYGDNSPFLYSETLPTFTAVADAAVYLRQGLVGRADSIALTMEFGPEFYDPNTYSATVSALADEIFYAAMAHTGIPQEGDYIRWQYDKCNQKISGQRYPDKLSVVFTFTPSYHSTAQQEEAVTDAVDALLAKLDMDRASDYYKVKAIYDYICENVTYDYENLNDKTYTLKHTAYAALINGTAVCQGYALLLYRLCLELGIDCRLIPGNTPGGAHGWNIIKLGDHYYNADSTWDAGQDPYDWFLVCPDNFPNHYRYNTTNLYYDTPEFHAAYPMANVDYTVTTLAQGSCGESLRWVLDSEGVLTVTGEGAMADYNAENPAPWSSNAEDIQIVSLDENLDHVGSYAFSGCENIWKISFQGDAPTFGQDPFLDVTAKAEYPIAASGWEETIGDQYGGALTWKVSCSDHHYVSSVTPPTCEDPGFTTYTCQCGYSYTADPVPALGHRFISYISNGDATCEKDGTRTVNCDREGCDVEDTVTDEESALGHNYGEWVHDAANKKHTKTCANDIKGDNKLDHVLEEKCTFTDTLKDGTITYTCETCKGSYSEVAKLYTDKKVYDFGEAINVTTNCELEDDTAWVGIFRKGETPGNGAHLAIYWYYVSEATNPMNILETRDNNNREFTAGEYTIYLFPNNEDYTPLATYDIEVTPVETGREEKAPTCESDGYLKITYSDGSEHIEKIPALGHEIGMPSFVWVEDYSTCVLTLTCGRDNCNETETCPCTVSGEFYTAANCKEQSYVIHTAVAGEYKDQVKMMGDIGPHSWSDATCSTPKTCVTCGAVDGDVLPHDYVDEICTACGKIEGLLYDFFAGEARITDYTGSRTTLDLPDTIEGKPVTRIGSLAFKGCTKLTSVTIPEGVTDISTSAFEGCTRLTSITIPSSVTSIGSSAFYGCFAIKDVYITDPSAWCKINYSGYYANPLMYASDASVHILDADGNDISNVVLDDSVSVIPSNAFKKCANLTSITIPDSVTSIGGGAFYGCANLSRVTIAEGVTIIGETAFYGCTSLTSITIPNSVTSIGSSAFEGCTGLSDITIGNKVASIGTYAFSGCSGLTNIVIPDSVTSIGSSAFSECTNLASVTLSNRLTDISHYMFSNCASLVSIKIPDSVTSIGGYAFYNCSSLTSVEIPNEVTSIYNTAFCGCSGLTSIIIPNSVTFIDYDAFVGCESLVDVYYGGDSAAWEALGTTMPEDARIHYSCTDPENHWFPTEKDPTCTEDGYIGEACICGYLRATATPSLGGHKDVAPKDHSCDVCDIPQGDHVAAEGKHSCNYCGMEVTSCIDENTDHACDVCAAPLGDHIAAEGEHNCDYCGKSVSNCSDKEKDGDHNCDICRSPMDGYICKDADSNHKCDECSKELSPCDDSDMNHKCNTCGADIGEHKDTDTDHECDYGCATAIGICEDKDNDGKCDYGCGKEFEVEPTEPEPTEPEVTEPKPTEPKPTEPEPTEPEAPKVEGVTRLAGENRLITSYLVADQMKAKMGIEKFEAIIVASGSTFADALPGSYLSAVKNAPIILTLAKDKYIQQTAEYIKANLAEGGTVYILGGESAVPYAMEAALSGVKFKRVAGEDRFGTNLEILKEAGVKAGDEILVCTAKEFADSLSAAATGKPILLVYKKLTDAQKSYLTTLSGNTFCVVGGKTAVPDNLLVEICDYGAASRLAGKDRLDTSILVAKKYFPNATTSVVAYGWDFPDGLCGGSLAYTMDAPLILTHSKDKLAKFTADYTVDAGLKAGYVLGGDGLVDDTATRAIFGMGSEPITLIK